ncbi:MAG TPA: DUF4878 domain-containing protein [Ignavibacteria bacterium]
MRNLILIILTAFAITGCGNTGGSDSPENAVKDFVAAVKDNNYNKAWAQLNEKSQRFFENKAKGRNTSGRDLFEQNVPNLKSLGILGEEFYIADQKQEEDLVTIIIKTNSGKTSEIFTEKEGGTWKLDYAKSISESINPEQQ